ncbi:MAG: hypothetical protein AAB574_01220 [Patescibacteria group bacterium]
MNSTKIGRLFLLLGITFFSTLFFWATFYFDIPGRIGIGHVSMETIWANYDGPNYLAISKCGYRPDCIRQNFSLSQPLEYYPAHFPGFSALINIFQPGLLSGPRAMLLVTLLGSLLLTTFSYLFFSLFFSPSNSFTLAAIFIFFPARIFILRQIGAPESWFIGSILASLYFFKQKKYFVSALFAAAAQTFKSPGIILFAAYLIHWLLTFIKTREINFKKYFWYLLSPLSVLVIFWLFQWHTGDFWAYFHSGDNIHLSLIPYSVFLSRNTWVNTIWLEDVIYIFGLSFVALFALYRRFKLKISFIFPFLFTLATVFVGHRDISRYIAPVYPFILLAFGRYLTKKSFRLVFLLLIPAVLLYALNFVAGNAAPIANWAPYL